MIPLYPETFSMEYMQDLELDKLVRYHIFSAAPSIGESLFHDRRVTSVRPFAHSWKFYWANLK